MTKPLELMYRAQLAPWWTVQPDLEQIVGRLSLEQYVSAATWQVGCAIPEA